MSGSGQPDLLLAGGVRLRAWRESDAPALAAACLDPDIQHWNRPGLLSEAEARLRIGRWRSRWQEEAAAIWAVAPAGGGEAGGGKAVGLIGVADLDPRGGSGEILYWLLPAGRGGGTMAAATVRVSRWAFDDLGLHRLRITHSTANPASCRTATKAGFPLEGTMRSALLHADGWHDEHLPARIAGDG